MIERLRRAIFTETVRLEPRTLLLLALAFRADLLKNAFAKKDLKKRKKRIEAVIEDDAIGRAAKEAIDAVNAAVAVAVVIPAVGAAT